MRLYVFIIYGFIGCVHIPYVFLIISIWKQCPFVPLTWPCPSSLLSLIYSHQNWTRYSSQKHKGRLTLFFFVSSVCPDHKQIRARFGPKKQSNISQMYFSSFHITVLCRNTYGNAFYFMPLSHLPPQTSCIYLVECEVIFTTSSNFPGRDQRILWGLESNLRGMRVAWAPGSCVVISAAVLLEGLHFSRPSLHCLTDIHVITKEETSGIHQFHLFGVTEDKCQI